MQVFEKRIWDLKNLRALRCEKNIAPKELATLRVSAIVIYRYDNGLRNAFIRVSAVAFFVLTIGYFI